MTESAKLIRFLIVGGGFSAFYAVTSAALVNFGAPPLVTGIGLWIACIPLAFLLQKRWAFGARNLRRGAIVWYALTQVAAVSLISALTVRFVTEVWWRDTLVYAAIAGLTAVLTFVVGRFFTFRERA